MRQALGGVLAPVTTPFEPEGGELDRQAFERNVRAHVAAGVSGVVVSGSTGEGALLDERERAQLIDWARPLVPGDGWLLAGTGAESTRQTVARCRVAGERGADAVLVVAPHYYGAAAMTDAALLGHYARVADTSPVPVVLYNIPKYAHFRLSPDLVATLARHDNVIGIKDSSGDLALLDAYVTATRETRFAVLTGNGGQLVDAMQRGARGAILAVAVFTGGLIPRIFADASAGDSAAAAAGQQRLTPMAQEIVGALGPAGVKAALDLVGLAGGPVRSPLQPLDADGRRKVRDVLKSGGVAVPDEIAGGAGSPGA